MTEFDSKLTEFDSKLTEFDSKMTEFDSKMTEFDSKLTEFDSIMTKFDSIMTEFDSKIVYVYNMTEKYKPKSRKLQEKSTLEKTGKIKKKSQKKIPKSFFIHHAASVIPTSRLVALACKRLEVKHEKCRQRHKSFRTFH